ncbi:S53 family peptidase [Saccharopolyspora sp. NPDC002376]
MAKKQARQLLEGSERKVPEGARRVRDAHPDSPVDVTVVLRRREEASTSERIKDRAEFTSRRGADPQDVARIEEFAHAHGLAVTSVNQAARSIGLSGTVAQMNAAFDVDLGHYQSAGETFRGREGRIGLPTDIAPAVRAVLGLDNRQQAKPHMRTVRPEVAAQAYAPQEVAKHYDFPTDVDGSGQTVAVIELAGGYEPDDLDTYFRNLKLRTPRITAVSVDGGRNLPGVDPDADGEVALDIEVIGAIAQGCDLAVYFSFQTTNGFYNAIAAAVHDAQRNPSVISISWGGPEPVWTPQAMTAYDELFADAAALGITVYAASGDEGAQDGLPSGKNVDFPASSPHVVGCGGTTMTATSETVWNELPGGGATGGGVSQLFSLPTYQQNVGVPDGFRGVPDVAGDADPSTGYRVRVNGQDTVIGGTSAVAPLWAALTALINQKLGHPIGDLHDALYAKSAAKAFNDITTGDNDGYEAGPGWDPCTGLGTPDGRKVAALLR